MRLLQDEEADQHKRYEQSYGVEATDAIPLGSKEDVAAELIQAAYRGWGNSIFRTLGSEASVCVCRHIMSPPATHLNPRPAL